MRIAICFYGLARSFRSLKDKYLRYLPDDADIFIKTYGHFYEGDNEDSTENAVTEKHFRDVFGDRLKNFSKCRMSKYIRESSFVVEVNKIAKMNWVGQHTHRIVSMMRLIKHVVNAKRHYERIHNFKYDCVILTRLDLDFACPLYIPPDLSKVYCPSGEGYKPDGSRKFGCAGVAGTDKQLNDQILISNSDNINIIGKIYDMIAKFHLDRIPINAETLIGHMLIRHNVRFEPTDIMTYIIKRV